jgi:hypothetical protein
MKSGTWSSSASSADCAVADRGEDLEVRPQLRELALQLRAQDLFVFSEDCRRHDRILAWALSSRLPRPPALLLLALVAANEPPDEEAHEDEGRERGHEGDHDRERDEDEEPDDDEPEP